MTSATIQPDVAAIDERISELRAERAQFLAQQQEADEALARAIANRVSDQERKKLHAAAATFADRIEEIDGALRFLEADREIALERAGTEAIRDARARMEEARAQRSAAFTELQAIVGEFARGTFTDGYKRLEQATGAVLSTQATYCRAVADDSVFDRIEAREIPNVPGISEEDAEQLWFALRPLAVIAGFQFGRLK